MGQINAIMGKSIRIVTELTEARSDDWSPREEITL
jgi:hypothetical protein